MNSNYEGREKLKREKGKTEGSRWLDYQLARDPWSNSEERRIYGPRP